MHLNQQNTFADVLNVFSSVDWLIPAYFQIGYIYRLSDQIDVAVKTRGIDAGRSVLWIALEKTYNEQYLSSMLLGLYCKTIYVKDFKAQIAEAIEASFLGLPHAAIATLIPVIEGVLRKIAQSEGRDIGNGTRKLIDEFDYMIILANTAPSKNDEFLLMLQSLKGFFEEKLLKNTNLYCGFDEFNRHGILHGVFESYGNRVNFFRSINIIDMLCRILMPLSRTSLFAPEATLESKKLANYYKTLGYVSSKAKVREILLA